MRRIPFIAAAILFLVIGRSAGLASLVVADKATMGHITGMAVDADGIGVAGVSVIVHRAGENAKPLGTAMTDEKGLFRVDVPAPASDLVVDLKGDVKPFPTTATKTGVAVEADKTTDLGKIEMKID